MPNILNGRFPHPLISYCLQVVNGQLRSLENHIVCYWDTPKNGNIAALTSHFLYLFARANLKSSKELQNHVFAAKLPKTELYNYIVSQFQVKKFCGSILTYKRLYLSSAFYALSLFLIQSTLSAA